MKRFCYITLINPLAQSKQIILKFELYPSNIAERWKDKIITAQKHNYKIDDPQRFYGFNDKKSEEQKALYLINDCITVINSHIPIIDRIITDINDQDTLNYLHHIFEIYHGLLDQQNSDYWNHAPIAVRKALAFLNIAVHRVESTSRNNTARFVVTYFGLPKQDKLSDLDFNYLTNFFNFGGLYLNYVEIGKTLEDLVRDNDQYIHPEAFIPWNYFSADFKVVFKNSDTVQAQTHLLDCKEYFQKNINFFQQQGYNEFTNRLKPGAISIGQLIYSDKNLIIEQIKNHQFVKSIVFD